MKRDALKKTSTAGIGVALLAVLIIAACGGGGTSQVTPPNNNDNPVPTVSTLSPSSAAVGAAAQTLTINGSNFLSSSTVTYNGAVHTASFVSSSQLSISLTISDQSAAGTFAVVVHNPTPGGGASNSVDFTVNNPTPSISSLSPSSATVGAGAQTLTINGTNFLSGSTVTFNGAAHTATLASSTQLTIALSTGDQATGGAFPVVVTNPTPGGGASSSVDFTVNNLSPGISSLSPASVTAGAAAQPLTINGTNFVSNSTVTYHGTAHTPTFVSATRLTISLSTGDLQTAGNFAVVVTNPAPGGGHSNSVNFVVNAASSITVSLNGSNSGSANLDAGAVLPITAIVTGAPANLSFTVNGVANGNATYGTITGSNSPYSYLAPVAIPGNDNPVLIVATQGGTGETASLTVTITRTGTSPTPITVSGGVASGINFSLSTQTTTLGLSDIGSCNYPTSGVCAASVTGIQISRSGATTNFCGGSTCTIWLIGQGLTNGGGSALASGLSVSVEHPRNSVDVSVGTVQPNSPVSGQTDIFIPITVTPSAPLGNRDIVVTLGDGETQVYTGAIQIVN